MLAKSKLHNSKPSLNYTGSVQLGVHRWPFRPDEPLVVSCSFSCLFVFILLVYT